jgi:hypothetical protein
LGETDKTYGKFHAVFELMRDRVTLVLSNREGECIYGERNIFWRGMRQHESETEGERNSSGEVVLVREREREREWQYECERVTVWEWEIERGREREGK